VEPLIGICRLLYTHICARLQIQTAGSPLLSVVLILLLVQVVFERPREQAFVRKWQLACEGDIAHVVVMPHVTLDKLSEFVSDLLASRARMGSSL
jgi:hypothetical protein